VNLQKDKQISMRADISEKKKNASSTSTKKHILDEDDKISSEDDAAKGLRSSSAGNFLLNCTPTPKVRNYSSDDERINH